MQIFVKIDKTIVLDVEPVELISDIMKKIQYKLGYPVTTGFYLNYRGKPLREELTLYDYNICKESTLHLAFRIDMNSITINIKYWNDKTISIIAKSFDYVDDLKGLIKEKTSFLPHQQKLYFNEEELLGGRLCIYGIKHETTITMKLTFIRVPIQIRSTNKTTTIDVNKDDTIANVKKEIIIKEGPLAILRIICKGITLDDEKILSFYKIDHKSTITVIQLIESDVSHFTSHELDNFLNDNLLKLDYNEDLELRAPLLALSEKATRSNAHSEEDGDDYNEEVVTKEKNGCLSDEHIAILNDFCSNIRMECRESASNLRIVLSDEMFKLLFDDNDSELLKCLKKLSTYEERQIVLISIKDTYVSFDMDDYDQDRNHHISLSTPTNGGVLCFYLSDHLVTIKPKTGALSSYNPTVLSGITKVQGTYNILAIVNEPSRWFRSEGKCKVIEVNQTMIGNYNSRKESWILKLALYLREKKDLKDRCLLKDKESMESKKRIRDLTAENVLLRGDENINNMNLESLNHAKKRAKLRLDDIETREQELLQTSETERMCVICKTELKKVALLPCKHFALCTICAANPILETCPLCRENIESSIELFV